MPEGCNMVLVYDDYPSSIECDYCGFRSARGSLFKKASDETVMCLDCYGANVAPSGKGSQG